MDESQSWCMKSLKTQNELKFDELVIYSLDDNLLGSNRLITNYALEKNQQNVL